MNPGAMTTPVAVDRAMPPGAQALRADRPRRSDRLRSPPSRRTRFPTGAVDDRAGQDEVGHARTLAPREAATARETSSSLTLFGMGVGTTLRRSAGRRGTTSRRPRAARPRRVRRGARRSAARGTTRCRRPASVRSPGRPSARTVRRSIRAPPSGIPGPASSTPMTTPSSCSLDQTRMCASGGVWRNAFAIRFSTIRSTFGPSIEAVTGATSVSINRASGFSTSATTRAISSADVGGTALRRDDAALQAIQVEQVAQEPLELARVGGDPMDQVERVFRRQFQAGSARASARSRGSRSAASADRARPPRGTCSSWRRVRGAAPPPLAREGTPPSTCARTREVSARPACAP